MLREIVEAIAGDKNSVDLTTSKSPATAITVIKYTHGGYGVLNYNMGGEAFEFFKKLGYKIDRNTNYPYMNFKTLAEVEKHIKKNFGIRNGLVELEFRKTLKEAHPLDGTGEDEYDIIERLLKEGKKPREIIKIMKSKYGTTKEDVEYILDELK